ncbi:hypothetical protein CEP54_000183 [Fusarium duplospermum]|uniref:Uncharacterized protein n=1 Tax=Fusarium duplospermum TaxID=1325734 RepID=A0A428R8L9_9HYPO|nr:hypothetical protein CEP54_000183 [Fusarium duplospermum]
MISESSDWPIGVGTPQPPDLRLRRHTLPPPRHPLGGLMSLAQLETPASCAQCLAASSLFFISSFIFDLPRDPALSFTLT